MLRRLFATRIGYAATDFIYFKPYEVPTKGKYEHHKLKIQMTYSSSYSSSDKDSHIYFTYKDKPCIIYYNESDIDVIDKCLKYYSKRNINKLDKLVKKNFNNRSNGKLNAFELEFAYKTLVKN
jgi:hypothetical protein